MREYWIGDTVHVLDNFFDLSDIAIRGAMNIYKDKEVNIVDKMEHPRWGTLYKIVLEGSHGYSGWWLEGKCMTASYKGLNKIIPERDLVNRFERRGFIDEALWYTSTWAPTPFTL